MSFGVRAGVQRDDQVDLRRTRRVAVLADADLVPGRQPLDVRREDVLARDGNPHPEDRLHEQAVGARRAGAVDGGDLEREVVDGAGSRGGSRGEDGASALAGSGFRSSVFRLPSSQTHTESPARTSAYPTPRSGIARRRARSAGRRLRPSPSRASSGAGRRRRTRPATGSPPAPRASIEGRSRHRPS